jgi:hypothetical protein
MTSDLVYRMRTCAAAMLDGHNTDRLRQDAADMLVEASNLLDEPEDLGLPMEILEAVAPAHAAAAPQGAHWGGGALPQRMFDFGAANPKPCPSCGAVDVRKVKIEHNHLMLICPRCAHHWRYAP